MSKSFYVLLYEDQESDKDEFIKSLKERAKQEGLCFWVVWFKHAFSYPSSQNDNGFQLELQPHDEPPELIELPDGGTPSKGKRTWWQGEFQGAILDIYRMGDPVGEEYAEWLEHAKFNGPVVLTSVKNIPTARFFWLPNLERVTKDASKTWINRSIDFLIHGLKFRDPQISIVNPQGRDPNLILRDFYQCARMEFGGGIRQWRFFWVSEDHGLGEKLHNFFELSLITRSIWNGIYEEPITDHWSDIIKRVDVIKTKQGQFKYKPPHVIWIDCGHTISAEDAKRVCKTLESISLIPLVFLLGDYVASLTQEIEDKLFYYGVCVLPRSLLDESPAQWAQGVIDRLTQVYQLYHPLHPYLLHSNTKKKAEKKPAESEIQKKYRIQMAKRLIQAYLPVYLMARAGMRIVGEDSANITSWLSTLPFAPRLLAKTFRGLPKAIWSELVELGMADERRLCFFNKQGMGRPRAYMSSLP